jgi:hypothetical protein
MRQPSDILKVAFPGDYLPRKCGNATFTTDLRCAVAEALPAMHCLVVPVNDLADENDYPSEVRFEIAEQGLPSHVRAADSPGYGGDCAQTARAREEFPHSPPQHFARAGVVDPGVFEGLC